MPSLHSSVHSRCRTCMQHIQPEMLACAQVLGSLQTTAQVHPEKLTKAMMAAAEKRGAQVRFGTVESVSSTEGPAAQVTGTNYFKGYALCL